MKAIDLDQLKYFLESLANDYDVRAPIQQHDGTRALGRLSEGPLAILGGKTPTKSTHVFFPQLDRIFRSDESGLSVEAPLLKPLFVVGLTTEDAECLAFISKFFSDNYRDTIYFKKYDGAVIVVVSGRCGKDGEFLRMTDGNCDLELSYDGQRFLVIPHSLTGKELGERIQVFVEVCPTAETAMRRESKKIPREDLRILERASELLLGEKIPDEFWKEISASCIACTGCNLSCPTCTCFEVFDWSSGIAAERFRLWDSCQLDGFMREASGHNPMGTESSRTRRRIHHKLGADKIRWGQITCMLCGRCDEVCPTGIGIKSVTRKMVERYG